MSAESKGRPKFGNFVFLDRYRAEFDRNGPLTSLIIEYLLDPDAAFAYAIRLPEVRVIARLGAQSNPTEAARFAVRTKNKENMLVLQKSHGGAIDWDDVFQMAISLGNVAIATQIKALCAKPWINRVSWVLMRDLPKMAEALVRWGAPPQYTMSVNYPMRSVKKFIELGGFSFGGYFANAARHGHLPVMKMLWKRAGPDTTIESKSAIREDAQEIALKYACGHGQLKVVRYLMACSSFARICAGDGLVKAAARGQAHVCLYLLTTPKDGPCWLISAAARAAAAISAAAHGRLATLKLLRQELGEAIWTKSLANECLEAAAENNHTRVAEFLWLDPVTPARGCSLMLLAAVRGGAIRSMWQAKDWGAMGFEYAIGFAKDDTTRDLLRRWAAEGP